MVVTAVSFPHLAIYYGTSGKDLVRLRRLSAHIVVLSLHERPHEMYTSRRGSARQRESLPDDCVVMKKGRQKPSL